MYEAITMPEEERAPYPTVNPGHGIVQTLCDS